MERVIEKDDSVEMTAIEKVKVESNCCHHLLSPSFVRIVCTN